MPLDEVMRDTTAMGGIAVYVVVAVIFFLLGNVKAGVQLIIALVLLYAVIAAVRTLFFRKRPDKQKYSGFFTKIDAGSFPSMHSARAAALAIILALVFPQNTIRVLLVIAVLAVAYTRIRLKRHYASDVIGGLVLGAVVAWAAIKLAPFFI
ncbi:MAG: phosphatase PAP2 family protein [Candidatus Woesearchaeota archaeon]